MATIVDVARLANVSRATVTRALNEPEKVKPDTRTRVQKAIRDLNYSPNLSARSLVSKNSGIVGLLLPNNKSGFFGSVMSVVHKKINDSGRMLMVLEGQGVVEEEKAIKKLSEINCDGFILYSRYLSIEIIKKHTQDKPTVLIDRKDSLCHSVYFDHFQASYELTQRLIAAGHRQIAIVAGPADRKSSVARLEGCLAAMRNADIVLPSSMFVQGTYDHQFGESATIQLIEQNPNLTAIVYCGERMCAGGLKSLRAKGISVPEDVSVVSFDSYNLTEILVPQIDSVVYPVTEMAELAADMVISNLSKQAVALKTRAVPHYFNPGESILKLDS